MSLVRNCGMKDWCGAPPLPQHRKDGYLETIGGLSGAPDLLPTHGSLRVYASAGVGAPLQPFIHPSHPSKDEPCGKDVFRGGAFRDKSREKVVLSGGNFKIF